MLNLWKDQLVIVQCECVNSCVVGMYWICSDSYYNIDPMSVKELSVLETVKEVTDFVLVQANRQQFRSLSFLRNLEVIHGRNLGRLIQFAIFTFLLFIGSFAIYDVLSLL